MDLPSARILVVGDSGTGKTCLLKSLCHVEDEIQQATKIQSIPTTQWTIGCDLHVLVRFPFFPLSFIVYYSTGNNGIFYRNIRIEKLME
jgi:GTPase SAR1 family protein